MPGNSLNISPDLFAGGQHINIVTGRNIAAAGKPVRNIRVISRHRVTLQTLPVQCIGLGSDNAFGVIAGAHGLNRRNAGLFNHGTGRAQPIDSVGKTAGHMIVKLVK